MTVVLSAFAGSNCQPLPFTSVNHTGDDCDLSNMVTYMGYRSHQSVCNGMALATNKDLLVILQFTNQINCICQ